MRNKRVLLVVWWMLNVNWSKLDDECRVWKAKPYEKLTTHCEQNEIR